MERVFHNIEASALEQRRYGIFVGISLGILHHITDDEICELMSWALSHSEGKVIVLVADVIAKYNYRVFGKTSEARSLRLARREGRKYVSYIEDLCARCLPRELDRIVVLVWDGIWDERKRMLKRELEQMYGLDPEFRRMIHSRLVRHATRRKRQLDDSEIEYLAQYILTELPTFLDGIEHQGKKYSLLLYPTTLKGSVRELLDDIERVGLMTKLDSLKSTERLPHVVEFCVQ